MGFPKDNGVSRVPAGIPREFFNGAQRDEKSPGAQGDGRNMDDRHHEQGWNVRPSDLRDPREPLIHEPFHDNMPGQPAGWQNINPYDDSGWFDRERQALLTQARHGLTTLATAGVLPQPAAGTRKARLIEELGETGGSPSDPRYDRAQPVP